MAAASTFGFPQKQWNESKQLIAEALIQQIATKESRPLTYTDAFDLIKHLIPFHDPHDTRFHQMLGQVSEDEDDAGRGLLTALVVHKDDWFPGEGWWKLAAERERDVRDKIKCWTDELKFLAKIHGPTH
jgi:Fe-S-cluster formation regulator IscX/YfhJ